MREPTPGSRPGQVPVARRWSSPPAEPILVQRPAVSPPGARTLSTGTSWATVGTRGGVVTTRMRSGKRRGRQRSVTSSPACTWSPSRSTRRTRVGRLCRSLGMQQRRVPGVASLPLSPKLNSAGPPNPGSRATIAFPQSDRPDATQAGDAYGDETSVNRRRRRRLSCRLSYR